MRVAAYLRCSTDVQDDSLDTQDTIIREYCANQGHELVDVYRDPAVSASIPVEQRPAGARLFADVKAKHRAFDAIIVLRLDRLFRDPGDEYGGVAYLAKHTCGLISIKDPIDRSTPVGELLHGIMMHVRAFERRQLGQRVKEHNEALALRGIWPAGPAPLGLTYDPETKRVSVSDRAADVVTLFRVYVETGGNSKETSRQLNRLGILTPMGKLWNSGQILQTLDCPVYERRVKYGAGESYAPDLIPEVVPSELVTQARYLRQITRGMPPRSKASKAVYSGLMYCADCGEIVWRQFSRIRSKASKQYQAWRCSGVVRGTCDGHSLSETYIDQMAGQALGLLLGRLADAVADQTPDVEEAPASVLRQRQRLEDRRARIVDMYDLGGIGREEFIKRLTDVDRELEALAEPVTPLVVTPEQVRDWCLRIADNWAGAEDRRRLLLAIGARFILQTSSDPCWLELETPLYPGPIRAYLDRSSDRRRTRRIPEK